MDRKRKLVVENPSEASKTSRTNESEINPFSGKPYSKRFYEILEKRKQLPIWEHKEQFVEVVKKHQVVVLVGETGSGKTTQVNIKCFFFQFDF